MREVVIATGNPHKIEELRSILGGLGIRALGLEDLDGPFAEPDETGSSFEENARLKARSYAAQTGRACLADDSGLEIDVLDGRPGVISSHYCTDGIETGLTRGERDRRNNERVLRELEGVPTEARGARFVCVMVLAGPDGRVLATARGEFEGRIGEARGPGREGVPRGRYGFGYDPIFLVAPEFARTSAELSSDEKNRLSHRARAAEAMATRVLEWTRRTGLERP
ncbi:MAG: RdgB/HAM1 family non-canonical purine NTP pyrophosphatase [Phycisphaeraceae bacterium]|nr:RdgB/HAM1 family non-canonical purine NTP pyrophosphatase [Phycisphaeraceae bacterium]